MIKKGMSVELENGLSLVIMDSVNFNGNKYVAAIKKLDNPDDNVDDMYFYKVVNEDSDNYSFVDIEQEFSDKIIDALVNHMCQTF